MTAMTLPASTDLGRDDTTFTDVLRSEWIKFRSVGSTRWTLLTAWAGTIAVGLIVCAAIAGHWNQMSATDRASFDPTFRSLTGLSLGQLAVGILGVLVIASEYATGMIRSTLAAVPGRRQVLAAKALVLAAPTFVIATLASLVAFLGGQALLASTGEGASMWANGELRAVIGGGVYLTLMAVFGLGLGLPIVVAPLPNPWGRDISQYLPSDAGQAFLQIHTSAGSLPPWAGLAVLAAWVAAALGTAAWLITRRDV